MEYVRTYSWYEIPYSWFTWLTNTQLTDRITSYSTLLMTLYLINIECLFLELVEFKNLFIIIHLTAWETSNYNLWPTDVFLYTTLNLAYSQNFQGINIREDPLISILTSTVQDMETWRSSLILYLGQKVLNTLKNSPNYCGLPLFNKLVDKIRAISDIGQFKKTLCSFAEWLFLISSLSCWNTLIIITCYHLVSLV